MCQCARCPLTRCQKTDKPTSGPTQTAPRFVKPEARALQSRTQVKR